MSKCRSFLRFPLLVGALLILGGTACSSDPSAPDDETDGEASGGKKPSGAGGMGGDDSDGSGGKGGSGGNTSSGGTVEGETPPPAGAEWYHALPSSGTITSLAIDGFGNICLAGWEDQESGFAGKYTPDGEKIWMSQFNSPAYAVACNLQGELFVGRHLFAGFVRKYDNDGSLVWEQEYSGLEQWRVLALAADSQGGVYGGGQVSGDVSFYEANIRHLDEEGSETWAETIVNHSDFDVSEAATLLAVESNGNLYAAGAVAKLFEDSAIIGEPLTDYDVGAFLRVYSRTGEVLSTRQWSSDKGSVLALASDGSIVLVSNTYNGNDELEGQSISKYDNVGELLWEDTAGEIRISGATIAASGEVFIVGSNWYTSSLGTMDARVRKYTTAGERAWTLDLESDQRNRAASIVLGNDGNSAYMAGSISDGYVNDVGSRLNQPYLAQIKTP